MKLVLSIDVEEEGLFRGRHPRRPAGVANVAELRRLEPLADEFRLVPTLLVAHAVAADPGCRAILRDWRDRRGAEIGAHLHPWSTPPFDGPGEDGPTDPDAVPEPLLRAKLEALLDAVGGLAGAPPVSFRMGRYHLTPAVARLAAAAGLRVDASLVPMRTEPGGPDSFDAPADPHAIDTPSGTLQEVPLTVIPIAPALARAWRRAAGALPPALGARCRAAFRRVGVVGVQPAWFGLAAMRHAARLHARRGGRVLHMHLHSSELMPGATPGCRTGADADRLVARIRAFLAWLADFMPVEMTPLSAWAGGPGAASAAGGTP